MDVLRAAAVKIGFPDTTELQRILHDPHGLFALLAVVVLALYGLSVGKTKALVSLLAVYVAYMLTALFPFLPWLTHTVPLPVIAPVMPVLVFLVLYLATFSLLSHSMMKSRLTLGEVSLVKVGLISVVQLGLMAGIAASLVSPDVAQRTLGGVYPFLAGTGALWGWAAASLAILPFMRTRRRD